MNETPHRLMDLTGILRSAHAADSQSEFEQLIRKFQASVWEASQIADATVPQTEILRELAYDLEFFVADERNRSEDPSYFGPKRAMSLIASGLEAIGHVAA